MEIINNKKRFRYLSGVIKFITEFRSRTLEEDIIKFEISFDEDEGYYYLSYEYRW